MGDRIEKPELVRRVAGRTGQDSTLVDELLEATLEEICAALKWGESVSLRTFGAFYVRPRPA